MAAADAEHVGDSLAMPPYEGAPAYSLGWGGKSRCGGGTWPMRGTAGQRPPAELRG